MGQCVRRKQNLAANLKATATRPAVAISHGHFLLAGACNSPQETGTPDTSDAPHAYSPSAVQALDSLALLPLLALGGRLADDLVGAFRVGGSRAHAFFVDDVPHGAHDTAVSARCWNNGLDVGGID